MRAFLNRVSGIGLLVNLRHPPGIDIYFDYCIVLFYLSIDYRMGNANRGIRLPEIWNTRYFYILNCFYKCNVLLEYVYIYTRIYMSLDWCMYLLYIIYIHNFPPGTLLTVKGRIITTRYGSNIAESDNGKEEKLLR